MTWAHNQTFRHRELYIEQQLKTKSLTVIGTLLVFQYFFTPTPYPPSPHTHTHTHKSLGKGPWNYLYSDLQHVWCFTEATQASNMDGTPHTSCGTLNQWRRLNWATERTTSNCSTSKRWKMTRDVVCCRLVGPFRRILYGQLVGGPGENSLVLDRILGIFHWSWVESSEELSDPG